MTLGASCLASPTGLETLTQIEQTGAKSVLEDFFGSPTAEKYLAERVSSGDPHWLAVAAKLLPASDAGASLALKNAIASALLNAPVAVLSLIKEDQPFSPRELCLPFMPAEEPAAQQLAYLDRVENKLKQVTAGAVQKQKTSCLAEVHSLRTALKAGKPNSGPGTDAALHAQSVSR